jgi:hypothetical protein
MIDASLGPASYGDFGRSLVLANSKFSQCRSINRLLVVNTTWFGALDKPVGDSIDEVADVVPRMATRLWLCPNPDRAVLA